MQINRFYLSVNLPIGEQFLNILLNINKNNRMKNFGYLLLLAVMLLFIACPGEIIDPDDPIDDVAALLQIGRASCRERV